jgi:hypothetical protein
LGSVVTVAYAMSFQKRSSSPLAGVRCCGLIPRRWDEALADRIVCVQVGGIDESSVARDAASSHSRLLSHWFLSSVVSREGPEKLELSELILNPDLGFCFTVAYAMSFEQRSSPPLYFCVRRCGLIPRRWDEALADIMQRGTRGKIKAFIWRYASGCLGRCA